MKSFIEVFLLWTLPTGTKGRTLKHFNIKQNIFPYSLLFLITSNFRMKLSIFPRCIYKFHIFFLINCTLLFTFIDWYLIQNCISLSWLRDTGMMHKECWDLIFILKKSFAMQHIGIFGFFLTDSTDQLLWHLFMGLFKTSFLGKGKGILRWIQFHPLGVFQEYRVHGSSMCPIGEDPGANPGHAGGMLSLSWPGNASVSPCRN